MALLTEAFNIFATSCPPSSTKQTYYYDLTCPKCGGVAYPVTNDGGSHAQCKKCSHPFMANKITPRKPTFPIYDLSCLKCGKQGHPTVLDGGSKAYCSICNVNYPTTRIN